MSKRISQRVYDLYARCYEGFELLFRRGVGRAIRHMPLRPGDQVLDVGVGTGLSLEFYPQTVDVTGIDLSVGMLAAARKRLEEGKVRVGCEGRTRLIQGDALNLPFRDGAFDGVFMSHVVATVPDPHRAMREAVRVVRDRGWVVMVNHFQSRYPAVSWVEMAIDPICRPLGWRCDLSLAALLGPLGVQRPRAAFGWTFQTVFLQKRGDGIVVVGPAEIAGAEAVVERA